MPQATPGTYKLTSDGPPSVSMFIVVDETGGDVTFGRMPYVPSIDAYAHAKAAIAIRCLGDGRFEAIVKPGTPQEQSYAGSCTKTADSA